MERSAQAEAWIAGTGPAMTPGRETPRLQHTQRFETFRIRTALSPHTMSFRRRPESMLKAIPQHRRGWKDADMDSGLRRNDPVDKGRFEPPYSEVAAPMRAVISISIFMPGSIIETMSMEAAGRISEKTGPTALTTASTSARSPT